jgi:hypothetical protein
VKQPGIISALPSARVAAHQDSEFDDNRSCVMTQLADTGQAHKMGLDTEGYFVVHLEKVEADFLGTFCYDPFPFHTSRRVRFHEEHL